MISISFKYLFEYLWFSHKIIYQSTQFVRFSGMHVPAFPFSHGMHSVYVFVFVCVCFVRMPHALWMCAIRRKSRQPNVKCARPMCHVRTCCAVMMYRCATKMVRNSFLFHVHLLTHTHTLPCEGERFNTHSRPETRLQCIVNRKSLRRDDQPEPSTTGTYIYLLHGVCHSVLVDSSVRNHFHHQPIAERPLSAVRRAVLGQHVEFLVCDRTASRSPPVGVARNASTLFESLQWPYVGCGAVPCEREYGGYLSTCWGARELNSERMTNMSDNIYSDRRRPNRIWTGAGTFWCYRYQR